MSKILTDPEFIACTSAATDCIIWLGYIDKATGYGRWKQNGEPWAHREAWRQANGAIPVGMYVCHTCDNRACVNPEHLFLGTQKDNMADMAKKGRRRTRASPGEKNGGGGKLKNSDVLNIRASELTPRELANLYKVTPTMIYNIINRKSWKHI